MFQLQQTNAALIYDVRPGFFFGLGHIPEANSWPKSKYAAQLASRETELRVAAAAKRPIVLYCTDLACPDSATVASRLAALGHSVAILEGGFEAWKTSGLPTE
jgi:rhodanese-related sulfurtransferase